jgi:hypothetical protein
VHQEWSCKEIQTPEEAMEQIASRLEKITQVMRAVQEPSADNATQMLCWIH